MAERAAKSEAKIQKEQEDAAKKQRVTDIDAEGKVLFHNPDGSEEVVTVQRGWPTPGQHC